MANPAYAAPWMLAAAQRNAGAYGPRDNPGALAGAALGSVGDWAGTAGDIAQASAMRDVALVNAGAGNVQAGLRAMGDIGSTGLSAQGTVNATGLKTYGDMASDEELAKLEIEKARILRGDSGFDRLLKVGRLAGGIGLGLGAMNMG